MNNFPVKKIQESKEDPFLKELKKQQQNLSDSEFQEWIKIVRKNSEARKPQMTQPEINFIVLGLAGMGKSTFLNFLLQQKAFSTGSTEQSSGVTKCMSSEKGTYGDYVLRAIDTPGFGDQTVSPKKWCIQLCFNAYKKEVDLLFFVMRADSHKIGRMNLLLAKFLALFVKDDPEGNPGKNIALVFTHTDKLNLKEKNALEQKCEKIKERFNETINKPWKIEKIFYFAKDQINDRRKIYEYAVENRKGKKLELQLPNLTLVKNILKEEFGDVGEQSPQKSSEKRNEKERDALKGEVADVGGQSSPRLGEEKDEKEKGNIEEEADHVGEQSSQRLTEKRNEQQNGALKEKVGEVGEQRSPRLRENKDEREKDSVEEEVGGVEEQSSPRLGEKRNEREKDTFEQEDEEVGGVEKQSSPRLSKKRKEKGHMEEEFGSVEEQSLPRFRETKDEKEKDSVEEEFGGVKEQSSPRLREEKSKRTRDTFEEESGDSGESRSPRLGEKRNEKEKGNIEEEFCTVEQQSSQRLSKKRNEKEKNGKVEVEKKDKKKNNSCLSLFGKRS